MNGTDIPTDRRLAKSGLSVRAYEMLKVLILDQDIAPGARLGIDLLAGELGVSQTPVREALARLEGDGLVIRNGNGRYHAAPLLDLATFDQLYVLRLLLEPFSAQEAARHVGARELTALRGHAQALRAAGTRGRSAEFAGYIAADSAFHEAIAAASRNQMLSDAVHHLHSHHRLGPLYRNRGVPDSVLAIGEHEMIYEAIASRDAESAGTLMRRHIERSRDELRPWLASMAGAAATQARGEE
jgi:DNA-binding GntR family transcriptional regulator